MIARQLRPYETLTRAGLVLAGAGLALVAGCAFQISNDAEAHDDWKKTYTLTQPGSVEIRNSSGAIDIEPGTGNTVDVAATRSVRAATDEAAKDALAHFEFDESVSPNRVAIDSSNRQAGLLLNLSRSVNYHLRVPRWASVTVDESNGDITVSGLAGTFRARATNGRVRATALENAASVSTTNGRIVLDFAKIGDGDVSCDTINGAITVTLPPDGKARLSARVTNGAIRTSGLNLSVSEQSARRLDASLGGGGPIVHLVTVNGAIEITSRKAP